MLHPHVVGNGLTLIHGRTLPQRVVHNRVPMRAFLSCHSKTAQTFDLYHYFPSSAEQQHTSRQTKSVGGGGGGHKTAQRGVVIVQRLWRRGGECGMRFGGGGGGLLRGPRASINMESNFDDARSST